MVGGGKSSGTASAKTDTCWGSIFSARMRGGRRGFRVRHGWILMRCIALER